MGCQEPYEIQVVHLGRKIPLQWQAGAWLAGEQICWKEPESGGVDGKQGMRQQCAAARAVLSMARRSRGMAASLYLALILPCLQHCVWFWASLFKKDINRLGWLQWRASKVARDWSTCPVRTGWGIWACSASPSDGFKGPNSRLQPHPAPQHLQAGHQRDRAWLLQAVQGG